MDINSHHKKLKNKFLEFEIQNNLLEKSISDKINPWAYSRFAIYHLILRNNNLIESKPIHSPRHFSFKLRNFIKQIIKKGIWSRNLLRIKKGLDILVVNHERKIFNGYTNICKYTHEWINYTELTVSVLEFPYKSFGTHFEDTFDSHNTYYADIINIYVKVMLPFATLNIDRNDKSKLRLIVNQLSIAFNLNDNEESQIYQTLIQSYVIAKIRVNLFIRFLRVKKPKSILVINAYDPQKMALIEAANILNISTLELQHGTISEFHIAYNYSIKGNFRWFPNHLLIWGDFWGQGIKYPINKSNIHIVGLHQVNSQNASSNKSHNSGMKVLFISQPLVSNEIMQMARNLSRKSTIKVFIKLHPLETRNLQDYLKKLDCKSIQVIGDENLYELFNQVDYVVGSYSTALYEAIYFNILPIVLTNFFGSETMERLIKAGYAASAETVEEIDAIISSNYYKDFKKFSISLFSNNSLKKMERTINDILINFRA